MWNELQTSLRMYAVTILICAMAYPLLLLGFAAVAAPEKRDGSLIRDAAGRVRGSALIAQGFTRPEYFWPRPSAAGEKGYDATSGSGSNLSPANPDLRKRAQSILARFQLREDESLPADLAAASGSGLDPHISLPAAEIQVPRVARARGLSENRVRALVRAHAEPIPLRTGVAVVNVFRLNMELDMSRE